MKIINILKHIGFIMAGVILLIGVPLWCTGGLHSLFSGSLDAVSSATVVLDAPSGDFIVLINRRLNSDEENLAEWSSFFCGEDFVYIFDDVSMSAAGSDAAGVEMAQSFQSKLPENQMKLYIEEGTMLLSRADAGLYDMILMSSEFAEQMKAQTAYRESAQVLEIRSEE